MSLQSFQSALALAIRTGDGHHSKSIQELTASFDLSSDEKFALENVISQQRLKAYSEELFLARWTIISEALEFLQPYIDFKAMNELWEHDFEKKSSNVVHEDLVMRFAQYLCTDEKGINFIKSNAPAFMPCLVRYLSSVFTFKHNYLPHYNLGPHSLLTDRYFEVIKLHYDVREFFAELIELDDFSAVSLKDPPQREIYILFVASDDVTEFRSFEIDGELADFLTREINAQERSPSLPTCYDALVELDLCKARGIKRSCCSKIH